MYRIDIAGHVYSQIIMSFIIGEYKKLIEDCIIECDKKELEINNCKDKKELSIIDIKSW